LAPHFASAPRTHDGKQPLNCGKRTDSNVPALSATVRNTHRLKRRLLIVAALALPAFAFTSGCRSTTPSGQAATDDAALASRVKQALAADPALKSLPISVATFRGVVQLSGYVDSEAQMQTAIMMARGVPGVQSVSNDLQLRSR